MIAHDPAHSWGAILTDDQLKKLATNRLLGLYRRTRRIFQVGYGDEYGLTHTETVPYLKRIKTELATRPHVKRHDTVRKKFKNGHKQKFIHVKFSR